MKLGYVSIVVIAIVLVFATVLTAYMLQGTPEVRSDSLLEGRSLVDASVEDINQYVLQYTQENYVVDGVPQILFTKSVTAQESFDLGLGIGNSINAERHYHAIILGGTFVRPSTGMHEAEAFHYIGYVFDLEAGIPTTVIDSVSGASLKQALGDPSIPDSPVPLRKPADLDFDPEDYVEGGSLDVPIDTTSSSPGKPVEGDYVEEYVDPTETTESTP